MIQAISQFVVIASLSMGAPIDAVQVESLAQNGYFQPLPIAAYEQQYGGLPVSSTVDFSPIKTNPYSHGILTTAPSALVMDVKSGAILFGKQPDQVRTIGSVTKLMSALVFLENASNFEELTELSAQDIVYGGRVYLALNDGVTVEDLLAASLVGSDNTATQSLIQASGMTEESFVKRMNEKALEMGMVSTYFDDVTGLSAKNTSTARDLTLLLAASEQNARIKKYTTTESIEVTQQSGRVVLIENTNKVLDSYLNDGSYSVEVGKTGFLPQAGYVLATTMQENHHDVFVVVLGSESKEARVSEVKGLADWAFRTFAWPEEL